MTDEDKEILEAVEELNEALYNTEQDTPHTFGFLNTGYFKAVLFNDEILWDSEDDTREYIETTDSYEPFLPFIKKVFNKYVDNLTKFKFVI